MSQNGLPDGTKTGKGSIADEQTKAIWAEAYRLYKLTPVETSDSKVERTERIGYVADRMGITRKAAKRRIKNYEGWQQRLDPSFKKFVPDLGREGMGQASGPSRGAEGAARAPSISAVQEGCARRKLRPKRRPNHRSILAL